MNKSTKKDALTLLRDDHQKVKKAFKEFEKLGDQAYSSKKDLAEDICQELEQHTKIEEEIFYPAFQKKTKGSKPLINEAVVEHGTAKDLIKQIRKMDAKDELFTAKVKVLGEYVNHHIKEEEEEMFPQFEKANIDLLALGEEMAERKQQLA